eukprot:scaffold1807_cov140-Cylindrotheca_fusiformis.AAC.21
MSTILTVVASVIVILLLLSLSYVLWQLLFRHSSSRRQQKQTSSSPKVFGFFHPYCSGGGGGERVLWKMIQLIQQSSPNNNNNKSEEEEVEVVIYTIDPPDTDEATLRKDAERRFDVHISKPVRLISLEEYKDYLLPSPYLSLVLESLGTMKLARQGLLRCSPDVFCDTTGCAFTFLVARWMMHPTAQILAYVHYPTISTDMMLWEWQQATTTSRQSNKKFLGKTILKLVYYWMFAIAYGIVGSLADLVMVNSTWTYNHIASLWRFTKEIHIVYPPCRVPSNSSSSSSTTTAEMKPPESSRQSTIVSIGQFRPEKDHPLQIKALARLLEKHPEHAKQVKLLLIGSCRNDEDERRVAALKELVTELQVQDQVEFSINPPYSDLQQSMYKASIGIHTMRQEHFGIGVVEMMAAGLITIAHNSGGPKADIVEDGVSGFLATTVDEYANAIHRALTLNNPQDMRQRAQQSATRFSDEVFDSSLEHVLSKSSLLLLLSMDNKKQD